MLFFPLIVSVFSLIFAHFLNRDLKKSLYGKENKIEEIKLTRKMVTFFVAAGSGLFLISLFYFFFERFWILTAICFLIGLVTIFLLFFPPKKTEEKNGKSAAENCKFPLGRFADMFHTYVISMAATMFLGSLLFPAHASAVLLPLYLVSVVTLAFLAFICFAKVIKSNKFFYSLLFAVILSIIVFYPIISQTAFDLEINPVNLYGSALVGFLVAVAALFVNFLPKRIFIVWPIVLIALTVLVGLWLGEFYGLALALISLLSLAGLTIIGDIQEKPGFKNYTAVSGSLAALLLFFVYAQKLSSLGKNIELVLWDPLVLAGLFLGGIIVYSFAFRKTSVFKKTFSKKKVLPIFLPVIFLILTGFVLGAEALAGLLIGMIIVGIFLTVLVKSSSIVVINPLVKTLGSAALLIASFLV